MNDEENPFINTRSPYALFNIGYYLLRKKEYGEKCKNKNDEKSKMNYLKKVKWVILYE